MVYGACAQADACIAWQPLPLNGIQVFRTRVHPSATESRMWKGVVNNAECRPPLAAKQTSGGESASRR
ncbi:hypothetical protein BC2230_90315 [Burkholderia cepacia]